MIKTKILQILGLAMVSGNLFWGTDMVIQNLKQAKLIFLANDASPKTKDKIIKKAYYYQVPVLEPFTSAEISNAIGKQNLMLISIKDTGFTKKILEFISLEKRGDPHEG